MKSLILIAALLSLSVSADTLVPHPGMNYYKNQVPVSIKSPDLKDTIEVTCHMNNRTYRYNTNWVLVTGNSIVIHSQGQNRNKVVVVPQSNCVIIQ